MKPSGIGGMAVMEGVMMKNKDEYAVAVRKPDNEIVIEKSTYKDFSDQVKLFKLPIFRGMMAFIDSLVIGIKVLNFSSSFFEDEDETQTKKNKEKLKKKDAKKSKNYDTDFEIVEISATGSESVKKEEISEEKKTEQAKKDEKSNALLMAFAVLLSIVFSVTLFMVLPTYIIEFFQRFTDNRFLLAFIEGMLRLMIFTGYVILASKMPEIKRVFMYHGAEHKTINCLENGFELTVENVRWQSKQHKRCGTSFMILVILISLVFFLILPVNGLLWRILSRILLVPFIAGVSYEFIRLAGKSESKIVNIISQPGLWMQGLTTKEPDDSMIEVAIQSVGAVFDWRAFLETSTTEEKNTKNSNTKNVTAAKQQTIVKTSVVGKQEKTAKTEGAVKSTNTEKPAQAEKTTGTANPADQPTTSKPQDVARRQSAPEIHFKPSVASRPEDEDDEILKALDKFFDEGVKDIKSGEK